MAPSPWKVADDDVTIPAGAGIRGNGDDEPRGEGQRFKGRPGRLAVTTPRQGSDEEAATTVPAEEASIRLRSTMASPGVSEGDCTTALGWLVAARQARVLWWGVGKWSQPPPSPLSRDSLGWV